MILINRKVTDNFLYSEFACPCCNILKLSDLFYRHIKKLQELRDLVKFNIRVTSGYRCEHHNKAVGGVNSSMHRLFATDIQPENGFGLEELYEAAVQLGFTGIGRYDTFIHLDLRPEKVRWDYRKKTA